MIAWLAQAETDALAAEGLSDAASGAGATGLTLPEVGLLVALLVAGVALLMLGRRLVKSVCVASGVVLGIAGACLAVSVWAELEPYQLPAVGAGALIGGVVSALLFRVWVAAAGAVILALTVPLASLAWQGSPLPVRGGGETGETQGAADEASADAGADASPLTTNLTDGIDIDREEVQRRVEEGVREGVDQARRAAGEVGSEIMDSIEGLFTRHRDTAEAWWDDLGPGGRRNVLIGAAIGAGLGLLLGVSLPYTAASLLSALAGALLVVFAGRTLAMALGGDTVQGWVPQGPRPVVLAVGLITLGGVVVQWMLRPRKSD